MAYRPDYFMGTVATGGLSGLSARIFHTRYQDGRLTSLSSAFEDLRMVGWGPVDEATIENGRMKGFRRKSSGLDGGHVVSALWLILHASLFYEKLCSQPHKIM